MDATISQIEENIRETETLSEQVITVSDQGAASVKNTVSGLEKIEISVGTISEAVESLGVRSQQIGNILKVIREIADQTNLLALNAAIIAAQAGEHGKGFAVVAEEIRDLAERTASSTSEVGEIVGAIQKDVSVAVKVAQEGKVRVQEGVKLGRTAETALQNISKQINMAGNSISHIARAAAEQAKGSSQVTEAIEEMTKRIEFISVATREQVQAGRNISKKTETMKELTSSVDSAMQEQAVGSDGISRGMEKLREAVGAIQHALLGMSQAGRQMVKSVDVIGGASGQTLGSSRDLSNTAANLRQDALLLAEELLRFKLPQPKRGGELRLGYTSYGYNLDPAYATNVRDGELVFNIHEGLVKFDYGTKVAPALAETWNVSADGRVYTFRLRKQAKFHNGKHVTAQDVIFAWHRCMSPVLDNTGKWFLNWVEGVEAFKEGAADSIAGLKTPDDSTVEVTLREPLAFFLYMLAAPEASIVPREAVDENTLRLMKPIGVGPYRVAESAPRSVTLQRFEEYYDPDEGYVDRLVFDYDSPTSDELKAKLKSGRIHLVPAMAPDSLEELLEDPEWRNLTESTILLNTSLVAVRCDLDPLSSREVRQALNYAVDKEFLVSRYPHSSPKPARGILPPGILGHNPSRSGYPYDPDKARWLLQRAGLASGFSLHVPTDTSRVNQQREFELIVDMLAKVGVRIEIEPLKHEEFLTRSHHEGRPPLYQTGWFADYPDPDNFIYVLFNSKAGDVLSLSYSNPEVDSLSERARSSLDISERIELYRKTEDILVEEAPFILLYHGMGVVPHRKEVMGLRLSMTPPVLRPGDVWFSQGS
jgi:ABC-type transport system substrate-binding protein